MWLVTRHQYGISALVSQTSFRGETSGGVAKCRLFAQATFSTSLLFRSFYVQTGATTPNIVGSCCVRFGSGVQTDATTPNNTQQGATRCVNGRNM